MPDPSLPPTSRPLEPDILDKFPEKISKNSGMPVPGNALYVVVSEMPDHVRTI